MKTYYECHITFLPASLFGAHTDASFAYKDVRDAGWIHSAIDGDPELGPGLKQYATKHFHIDTDEVEIIKEMENVSDTLVMKGHDVLRNKIEKVIYDRRIKDAL